MAAHQELEIQLAQKLASNEKPIRTKALKKLKKYIYVRSQKATDGFTREEMLKLWKGLFYCLWMQDKPLLQEELSNSVSTLIHTFHDVNGQLLYLECSLKTFKREWNGIDRLRMDKYFQLIRFMFRQGFEMLKRKNWDSSVVARFLELFATELLNSGNDAPASLQLHILDLFLTELAAVGSSELSAEQNLRFIEPFCKTATKTKDWTLFRAICNSIFSTIIDQAPYAIEDLLKELKAESSDAGSELYVEQDNHGSGDFDTELPFDDDNVAPVLQFDYAALADKLLAMSSRSSTPSQNRQKIYKIIKVLQDLSEGIFPQDGYPEEVSTDEDDEMFGSRNKMKRGKKKNKLKQNDDSGKDVKTTDLIHKDTTKPRIKKRRACHGDHLNAGVSNMEGTNVPNQSKSLLNESEDDKAAKQSTVSASDKARKLNSGITNKNKSKKKTSGGKEESENETHTPPQRFASQVRWMVDPVSCEITLSELQVLNNAKTKERGLKGPKVNSFAACSQQIPFDSLSLPCDDSADVDTALKLEDLAELTALPECKRGKNEAEKVMIASKSNTNENECASNPQMGTPLKKNKRSSAQVKDVSSMEKNTKEAYYSPKKLNKKRKIPVVLEFEAAELEFATPTSDIVDRAPGVKKIKRSSKVPTPLIFSTEANCKNPVFGNEIGHTPTSDSKKVTFHLKNNKTAGRPQSGTGRLGFDQEYQEEELAFTQVGRSLFGTTHDT
ncbi:ribosomal RNA processing protein 1 homolog B isoform X2 [Syngnathus scovelli]|uniref:ribosomal RNA processing protein 1 homolog B isoform X2 n=1 Tax=Syngnathus scovelli TaxID=161590 RepID=UPI00210F8F06|nr:ribosomal RNA processing protein 1 homolog B isoform X2 [Syngnathus scovelli]